MAPDDYEIELIAPYYNQKLSFDEIVEREQFEYNFFIKMIVKTLGRPPGDSELKIDIIPSDFDQDGAQVYKEIRYYYDMLQESHLSYILQILSLYGNENWKDNYYKEFEREFTAISKYKIKNYSGDMVMNETNCSKSIQKSKQTISTKLLVNYNSKRLQKKIKEYLDEPIYYYIIKSVDLVNNKFIQKGSGPNLEGDIITLCTCKHKMRTYPKIDRGTWIAGITSKNIGGNIGNYVFYLARIKETFYSHYELWEYFKKHAPSTLKLKNSINNPLGDIFFPKTKTIGDKFDPNEYHKPIKGHSHQKNWHDDIKIRYNKPSKLLVFDPEYSFVWNSPVIKMKPYKLTQGQRRKDTIHEFLEMEAI